MHFLLAATAVVSLCACGVTSAPTAPSALIADALPTAEGFEPAFYRALLFNGYESPNRLEPIRLLRGPLRIYLRTLDEAGAVDERSLDLVERTLLDGVTVWSGDTFGITDIERGTGTREQVPGWLTVKWTNRPAIECGRATVGVDGGYIELNSSGACSCGLNTVVYPRLVRHELGHAMGYYHTDGTSDVMFGRSIPSAGCGAGPSERERVHARFAHAQARLSAMARRR